MIIKQVKYESGLIFKKEELTVLSNEGRGRIKFSKNKDTIKELNTKLQGLEVNSISDLQKIDTITKEVDIELLPYISLTALNSAKYPWIIVDKAARQIPRPIVSVFKKNKGVKEFFVLSLDVTNFEAMINSAGEIQAQLAKKLSSIKRSSDEELKDEDILDYLKEIVDEVYKEINFDIRIGVRFDNFEGEYYTYHGKNFSKEEQYKYIAALIDNYSLLYVENPFKEEDEKELSKLNNKFKSVCLVTLNSKINEYTKLVDNEECNSVILKFNDLTDFKSNTEYLRDNKVNIIGECKKELVSLFVGFGINLVKVNDLKDLEDIRSFTELAEKIREYLNEYSN